MRCMEQYLVPCKRPQVVGDSRQMTHIVLLCLLLSSRRSRRLTSSNAVCSVAAIIASCSVSATTCSAWSAVDVVDLKTCWSSSDSPAMALSGSSKDIAEPELLETAERGKDALDRERDLGVLAKSWRWGRFKSGSRANCSTFVGTRPAASCSSSRSPAKQHRLPYRCERYSVPDTKKHQICSVPAQSPHHEAWCQPHPKMEFARQSGHARNTHAKRRRLPREPVYTGKHAQYPYFAWIGI